MSRALAAAAERILVVDDNQQNRDLTRVNLDTAGYLVEVADSGAAALERFGSFSPDLILLDILMPDMDGFETCSRLRQLPECADVPIVFLTFMADLATHRNALLSGADDFLSKPIQRTELLMRIRSLLRIRRLKNQLQRNNEALITMSNQKEELNGFIVHDLKNPLAVILGNARFIEADPTSPSMVVDLSGTIVRAAKQMNRMILNILDVSRSEEGRLQPLLIAVDVVGLCKDVRTAVRRRAADNQHDVVVTSEFAEKVLALDEDLIRRVIENLVENSLKYTPVGGNIQIQIAAADGGATDIRICDEGPGIPAVLRERIFEKYFQIDRDAPDARTGRGLGLAYCRLAVEAHDGRIWVDDNLPHGSRFCVRLPA